MMAIRMLAIALSLTACGGSLQASEFHQYEYVVIGGKPGALAETLQLDCRTLRATFARGTTGTSDFVSVDGSVSKAQCEQIQQSAQALCVNQVNHDAMINDGATYTLSCKGEGGITQWSWYGSLRKAPEALQKLHLQTRALISNALGNPAHYP